MNTKTMLNNVDWFQTVSMLALLAGVLLVAYELRVTHEELRQSREISLAQMGTEGWSFGAQQNSVFLAEETIDAIVKSCFGEPLNQKEIVVALCELCGSAGNGSSL